MPPLGFGVNPSYDFASFAQGSEFGELSLIRSVLGRRNSLGTPAQNLAHGGIVERLHQDYNNRIVELLSQPRSGGSQRTAQNFLNIPEYLGLRETQQYLGDVATRGRGYGAESNSRISGSGFRLLGA